jgi:prepilin-type N-terminal cleavage/methylation domain-containing protein
MFKKTSKAFSLIELLIVLAVVGILAAIIFTGISNFSSNLQLNFAVDQVTADVKYAQQLARTSHETCEIRFKAGEPRYSITKSGAAVRTSTLSSSLKFFGKTYFAFAPSGDTEVGGSGTLVVIGRYRGKKVIVSSRGRIRIE